MIMELKPPTIKKLDGKKSVIEYPDGTRIEYTEEKDTQGFECSIEALYPTFRNRVLEFKKSLEELGYRFLVTNTIRTKEQVEMLYKQNPKVAVKQSPHEFGVAVDFYIVDKSGRNVLREPKEQEIIAQLCKKHNLFWGMWFRSFTKEPWHIQVSDDWRAWYKNNVMKG